MTFNSYQFILIFLPLAWLGYAIAVWLNKEYVAKWFCIVSLIFYGQWGLNSIPIVVGSIFFNYTLGGLIQTSVNISHKKKLVVVGVIVNLTLLAYFKYTNFFIENIQKFVNVEIPLLDIFFPIGISFYTFTQISYLLECSGGRLKNNNIYNYFAFVLYFPHLLSGPIIKYSIIAPQFELKNIINTRNILFGVIIFSIGLSKKVLIADYIGRMIDPIYLAIENGLVPKFLLSLIITIGYTIQIYFDFSGYSDMAIGVSLIFGVFLPINFNSPLQAKCIIELWNRWHISLTNFFRECLYYPVTYRILRGMQHFSPDQQKYVQIFIPTLFVMTLIGFWHGGTWNCIIFGLLNGFLLIVNNLYREFVRKINIATLKTDSIKKLYWFFTFFGFSIGLIFLRASNLDDAIIIIKGLLFINGINVPNYLASLINYRLFGDGLMQGLESIDLLTLLILISSLYIALFAKNTSESYINYQKTGFINISNKKVFIAGILFILSLSQLNMPTKFLYFQF